MSKYNPLWIFIKQQNKDNFKMTFDEIKEVLGFPIDHSFLNYKKELSEFGYQTGKISLKEQTIIFKKITS
ncbi:MAG: hypothetical protein GXY27_05305 [Erysipelotrichaceae bacterium]|nr:hypothetical protein [Erysipelotrichaceae bacterium]